MAASEGSSTIGALSTTEIDVNEKDHPPSVNEPWLGALPGVHFWLRTGIYPPKVSELTTKQNPPPPPGRVLEFLTKADSLGSNAVGCVRLRAVGAHTLALCLPRRLLAVGCASGKVELFDFPTDVHQVSTI